MKYFAASWRRVFTMVSNAICCTGTKPDLSPFVCWSTIIGTKFHQELNKSDNFPASYSCTSSELSFFLKNLNSGLMKYGGYEALIYIVILITVGVSTAYNF